MIHQQAGKCEKGELGVAENVVEWAPEERHC